MKIRKTKKMLKNYLANLGICDITIKFDSDYSFNEYGNIITIGIEKGNSQAFIDLCKKLGYKGSATLKELCFAHELGHYFTHKNFNEIQEQYDQMVRIHLYKAVESDNMAIAQKALQCYYHLPQEIEATKYGLKLLDNYKQVC